MNPLPNDSEPQRVFDDFVARRNDGEEVEIDDLCRNHPELADDLRQLWARHLIAEAVPTRATASENPDQAGEPLSAGASAEILRRLAERDGTHDRYVVEGEVARGGQGVVLRVWDEDLRRNLAMKVILGRGEKDSAKPLARFLEEAQVTGQLDHPGIVPVHELGLDSKGRVYFTMKLVKGHDFKTIIEKVHGGQDGWTVTRALGVMLKTCEAIAYAHSKGVIHRDLKPGNLMVGRFGEVYVMDWGLAQIAGSEKRAADGGVDRAMISSLVVETERLLDKESTPDSPLFTKDGDVVGTPAYMSPEQARGDLDRMGPSSDIYSVGAILYHLLVGHPPFVPPGTDLVPYVVLKMLISGPPTAVQKIARGGAPELAQICEKAMAREPEERYATSMDLARDIEAFLGNRPISARPRSRLNELKLSFRRNPRAAMAFAIGLVLAVGVLLVDSVRVRKSRRAAAASQQETQRLLDFASARSLVLAIDDLYVPENDLASEMEAWLARTDALLGGADAYRVELADVVASGAEPNEQLERAVKDFRALEQARPAIAEQLVELETLHQRTVVQYGREWREAIASIASSETYGRRTIEPQTGLVPLQPNPETGMWEFWHVLSGDKPYADPATGKVRLTEESGIVLVLLPGGRCDIGSPDSEPGRQPDETRHGVDIAPFFMSKFEVTQAQWVRAMGSNPAHLPPGFHELSLFSNLPGTAEVDSLHPVENVTWHECRALAAQLRLRLPTEAEWEYSCRAGNDSVYTWGTDVADLEGRENICDQSFAPKTATSTGVTWNDDFPFHSPVGSFEANGFGLYDVHGNVAEWCADDYIDGQDPPSQRVFRGGSWYHTPIDVRSAFRQHNKPRIFTATIGVRLAGSLQ